MSTAVLLTLALAASDLSPQAQQEAKELAHRSQLEYDLDHADAALRDIERAYFLDPLPGLLFNLGQCHRKLGHWEKAETAYRNYLRYKPEAPNRETVLQLIEEMHRNVEQEQERERDREQERERQRRAEAVMVVPAPAPRPPPPPSAVTAPLPSPPVASPPPSERPKRSPWTFGPRNRHSPVPPTRWLGRSLGLAPLQRRSRSWEPSRCRTTNLPALR